MMREEGLVFEGSTEALDGRAFADCTFRGCTLVYNGGPLPSITGCQFDGCRWEFGDAAERTLVFMSALYKHMGSGGPELVERMFDAIRTGG
jgi:hypothetical protein